MARKPEWMTLVEVTLDTGTYRHAFHGTATDLGWYDDKLTSAGSTTRAVPLLPGDAKISDGNFSIFDFPDRIYGKARAKTSFRNRTVKYKFGNRTAGLESFIELVTGKITNYSFKADGQVSFSFRDATYDKLRNPLQGRLNKIDFPYLPESTPKALMPILYGVFSTYTNTGAVPAYRVDPGLSGDGKFRYLLARHPVHQIARVYRYGAQLGAASPATWEYWTRAVGTPPKQMSFIEFPTDPRIAGQTDELEITAELWGMTYDGNPFTPYITNPFYQLKHFLQNYACVPPLTEAEISVPHFDEAIAKANLAPVYEGHFWIGDSNEDEEITALDVINRFNKSFGSSFFMTRTGKHAVSFFKVADSFNWTEEYAHLSDENEIFRETFEVVPTTEVASQITYQTTPNYKTNQYEGPQPTMIAAQAQGQLGQSIPIADTFTYLREFTTAHEVAATRLLYMQEGVQYVRFTLPPEFYTLDLNDIIEIDHEFGPGKEGWKGVYVRIIELVLDMTPGQETISVTAVRIVPEGAAGHSDAHVDQHSDGAHGDAHTDGGGHVDQAHTDSHTDDNPGHGDLHQDTPHSDTAHTNTAAHQDTAHGDVGAHTDVFHGNSHNDSGHVDIAHQDFHSDSYNHIDYPDASAGHGDAEGVHSNAHSDVTHQDVPPDSAHTDTPHQDTTGHTDTPHGDASHGDVAHTDVAHGDVNPHVDAIHGDIHGDLPHNDGGPHGDSHTDAGHQDSPHADYHSDVTNTGGALLREALKDALESQPHGDVLPEEPPEAVQLPESGETPEAGPKDEK